MKIVIKRSSTDRKINKWFIFAIIIFVFVAVAGYYMLNVSAITNQNNGLSILNAECSSYAQMLTSEVSLNSSACQQAKDLNLSNGTVACGATFYCSYSYSCTSQKPVQNTTLNCLCDVLKSNSVVAGGLCFKQQIS